MSLFVEGLSSSHLIGSLLAGTVLGILMSYLARRKGWNEVLWMLAGWASGAFLGFLVGGAVVGVAFYLLRVYHLSKTVAPFSSPNKHPGSTENTDGPSNTPR